MRDQPKASSRFTANELAVQIVDTLIDRGLVERMSLQLAFDAVSWELNAQHAMNRIGLREVPGNSAGV